MRKVLNSDFPTFGNSITSEIACVKGNLIQNFWVFRACQLYLVPVAFSVFQWLQWKPASGTRYEWLVLGDLPAVPGTNGRLLLDKRSKNVYYAFASSFRYRSCDNGKGRSFSRAPVFSVFFGYGCGKLKGLGIGLWIKLWKTGGLWISLWVKLWKTNNWVWKRLLKTK